MSDNDLLLSNGPAARSTSTWWFRIEMRSGVVPCPGVWLTSARRDFKRVIHTSHSPFIAAIYKGHAPLLMGSVGSAFVSSSSLTMSLCPFLGANPFLLSYAKQVNFNHGGFFWQSFRTCLSHFVQKLSISVHICSHLCTLCWFEAVLNCFGSQENQSTNWNCIHSKLYKASILGKHDIMPKVLGADKEGRGAVCVLYIRIGSFMQQQSEGVRVIILGSYVQRSCLIMLALVDISTCFKKVLCN